jgi:DNA mismatch repair protein MutS
MGTRLLARWLARPTQDLALLGARQDAIAYLAAGQDSRAALRAQLGGVGDIERLTTRCAQERATPQELLALATALETLPALCSLVPDSAPVLISALRLALDPAPDIAAGIRAAVAEQGSGRIIQRGFDPDLDSMLSRIDEAREKLAQLETLERERTGIRSLKVAFNQVFGYYLEVTQANLSRVPAHYVRKQTLAHAERYVCPELTQWEARLREAESAADDLERACYSRVLQRIGANAPRLLQTGAAVARLDVLCNLAEVAATERFVRPILLKEPELSILGGRHPLVEAAVGRGAFIPNDCVLGGTEATLAIVTGPNMGGKSTYLRQVALIVYLAHIGSFVPAAAARIGTVDRIFARIGAHDDLEGGQSTFLVEMGETAAITRQATAHSLILLDEIGRGTTSVDGQAIAQAVAEYLHDHAGARTLFATHYYDLARAAAQWPRACNLHVQAEEQEGAVVFLYTVDQGIASKSYALHVAQMAGMPEQITMRAQELMESVQEGQASMAPDKQAHQHLDPPARLASRPLLRLAEQPAPYAGVIDTLLQFTIASMTPIEALNALFALQQQARRLEAEPEAGMHHPTEKTAW